MLKLCKYGYGNFKKHKRVIPSHNMILNTTVQIFRLLLSRKYVCRIISINRNFSGPAERVRLITCRLIGNYHDREFMLYLIPVKVERGLHGWFEDQPPLDNRFVLLSPWETHQLLILLMMREYLKNPLLGRRLWILCFSQYSLVLDMPAQG